MNIINFINPFPRFFLYWIHQRTNDPARDHL